MRAVAVTFETRPRGPSALAVCARWRTLGRMQQSAPWYLVPAIVVGFVVMFTTIWSGVSGLLALMSGWRSMAERYAAPEGLHGAPLASGHAVRLGVSRYRGVMSFEAAPQGLIVRVMRLFPFHPTLLIPWDALSLARVSGFFTAGTMTVRNGATFALNGDAFSSIEGALRAQGYQTARG
jgi:hypothetical protein